MRQVFKTLASSLYASTLATGEKEPFLSSSCFPFLFLHSSFCYPYFICVICLFLLPSPNSYFRSISFSSPFLLFLLFPSCFSPITFFVCFFLLYSSSSFSCPLAFPSSHLSDLFVFHFYIFFLSPFILYSSRFSVFFLFCPLLFFLKKMFLNVFL